jgi:thiol-disulfide isomerase/thioredoxin
MFRIAALLFLALTAFSQQQPAPRRAPDFTIQQVGAPDLKLRTYRGKVVVLALLNTGCPHCQHFAQQLAHYQTEYGPKGVQVLAVVFDREARDGLTTFRDRYVKGFPVGYSDEATVMNWLEQPVDQGYFVPIVAFIDRAGMIQGQYMGDDDFFQDPDGNIRRKLDRLVRQPAAK